MMRNKRTVAMTAIAITVALGATACGGSKSGGSNASGSTGQRISGGTLVYYAPNDFAHIDPQRTYTTQGMNIDQELVRTLTGWSQSPGSGAPKLVGDLATDTGTASNDDKTWTFHIRPGVKWQDGTAVTSYDVKYGVERAASPDITNGTTYWQWLVGSANYKGPYQGKSLPSIETPDASTIIFQLSSPQVEFPEAAAMDTFAAVPKAHDTGSSYDTGLYSDGPYELKSYTHGKEMILVKNPYWSAATDHQDGSGPGVHRPADEGRPGHRPGRDHRGPDRRHRPHPVHHGPDAEVADPQHRDPRRRLHRDEHHDHQEREGPRGHRRRDQQGDLPGRHGRLRVR
jgi:peptide/nickel transport system substrate-binding protein